MKIKMSEGRKLATQMKGARAIFKKSRAATKGKLRTQGKSNAEINRAGQMTGKGFNAGMIGGRKVATHLKANKGKYLAGGAVAGAAMVGGAVKKRQEDKKFKNRAKKFLGM